LKDEVRNTFGTALKVVWQMVLGIAIAGILCNIGIKQLKLHTEIDKDWGRDDNPDDSGWSFRSALSLARHATRTEKVQSA
jgi:hypothetical protein